MKNKTILITGAAGFIGFSLVDYLFKNGVIYNVVGIDNLNDYYDVNLKKARLEVLKKYSNFHFLKLDISNKEEMINLFNKYNFDVVINLAAQAGVRYSITNPDAYIQSNVIGFFNILECVRHHNVKHLIYASSSSVYGGNKKVPYSEEDKVTKPVSLYAASKLSNELFAYSYCKLYKIPMTGLRFFTVYGPYGRPDMAYFSFTNKLRKKEPVTLFNYGDMYRDFTYIDDICVTISKIIESDVKLNDDKLPHQIYNIGNHNPVSLKEFYDTLCECLIDQGIIDEKIGPKYAEMQKGDVYQTYADTTKLRKDFDFNPSTSLKDGLTKYARWYKDYYLK